MSETDLSDEDRKVYAVHVMKQAAKEPDFVGLFEGYSEFTGDYDVDLSDADGRAIDDLIRSAEVTITWPAAEKSDERPTIVGDLNSGAVVILDEGDWCPRCGAPNADEDGHDPSCPMGQPVVLHGDTVCSGAGCDHPIHG